MLLLQHHSMYAYRLLTPPSVHCHELKPQLDVILLECEKLKLYTQWAEKKRAEENQTTGKHGIKITCCGYTELNCSQH